jgi:hypothetical protein
LKDSRPNSWILLRFGNILGLMPTCGSLSRESALSQENPLIQEPPLQHEILNNAQVRISHIGQSKPFWRALYHVHIFMSKISFILIKAQTSSKLRFTRH